MPSITDPLRDAPQDFLDGLERNRESDRRALQELQGKVEELAQRHDAPLLLSRDEAIDYLNAEFRRLGILPAEP